MIPNSQAAEIICVDSRTFREWGNQGYYSVSVEGISEETLGWIWFNKVQPVLNTAKINPGLAFDRAKIILGRDVAALSPDKETMEEALTRPVVLTPVVKEIELDSWEEEDELWKPVVISEETHHASGRKKRSDSGKPRGKYRPRANKRA